MPGALFCTLFKGDLAYIYVGHLAAPSRRELREVRVSAGVEAGGRKPPPSSSSAARLETDRAPPEEVAVDTDQDPLQKAE